jgi:hypothetical protein
MKKHGIDVGITGTAVRQRNVSLNLFLNGAFLHQEVADMGGAPPIKTGGSYSRYRQYLIKGYAPGSFFAPKLADVAIPINLGFKNADGSCREPTQAEALAYFGSARKPEDFKPLVHGNTALGVPDGKLASFSPNCGAGVLNTYLGKSTPDWSGTFGFTLGFLGNFEMTSTMEFYAGNFLYHDLSGEFRRSSPTIGRNVPNCATYEAAIRNPASSAQDRLTNAVSWEHECEGLSPFDGLNSITNADHVRWRELTLTYRVPTRLIDHWGLANATISVGGRNIALWTKGDFKGMDPEVTLAGRCNGGTDCNFLDATDGWNVPIPRRITFSTRVSF